MPQLPIAIELACLRRPFKQALVTAARLGARGVEIDARAADGPRSLSATGVRALQHLLAELNLRVVSVGFHTRRGYDAPEDLDRRVESTKEAMALAAQLRAPVVINQIGRVPAEAKGSEWDQLVEVLGDLAEHGLRIGARLAAQTGTESGADLARLLDALPPQGVVADLDPGLLIIGGFSPADAVQALGERIAHVHARDGVRDLARGRGLETPLGRGSVDFPAILGALEEFGYRGPLTITRDASDDPESDFELAVQYLKSL